MAKKREAKNKNGGMCCGGCKRELGGLDKICVILGSLVLASILVISAVGLLTNTEGEVMGDSIYKGTLHNVCKELYGPEWEYKEEGFGPTFEFHCVRVSWDNERVIDTKTWGEHATRRSSKLREQEHYDELQELTRNMQER